MRVMLMAHFLHENMKKDLQLFSDSDNGGKQLLQVYFLPNIILHYYSSQVVHTDKCHANTAYTCY